MPTLDKLAANGVTYSQWHHGPVGSRFGGHSLFLKDKKLYYVYNFLGIGAEQEVASAPLKPGKYTLGMEFIREKAGPNHESLGKVKLYVDDQVVAEAPLRTQPGNFTLSGDGLCVGYDSGDAVSKHYKSPGKFVGGKILGVGVTTEKTDYSDLEKEAISERPSSTSQRSGTTAIAATKLPPPPPCRSCSEKRPPPNAPRPSVKRLKDSVCSGSATPGSAWAWIRSGASSASARSKKDADLSARVTMVWSSLLTPSRGTIPSQPPRSP